MKKSFFYCAILTCLFPFILSLPSCNWNSKEQTCEDLEALAVEEPKMKFVVAGATGETGRILTRYLLNQNKTSKVVAFVRSKKEIDFFRVSSQEFGKLTQIEEPDFDQLEKYAPQVEGFDAAFSCMGTTRARSPSTEEYNKVEFLALKYASTCALAKVPRFYLVTAEGADKTSWNVYLRTKAEVEEGVVNLGFQRVVSFRPGLIMGITRSTRSWWEGPSARVVSFLDSVLPAKYQELHLTRIAQSMLLTAFTDIEGGVTGVQALGVEDMKKLTPQMSNFPEGWYPYDGEKPLHQDKVPQ